jgi:general secretion pathway protein G
MNVRVFRSGGFTLVELLVVIVILGLLAGVVAPRVLQYLGASRVDSAKLQLAELATALDVYRMDLGSYPTTEQGLEALLTAPAAATRWAGPYVGRRQAVVDPWGTAFQYRAMTDDTYELYSLGADGRRGGEGDDADLHASD